VRAPELFAEEWSTYECAGGFALRDLRYTSCAITEAKDGVDALRLMVPRAQGQSLKMRACIRTVDALGVVREFRVRRNAWARNDAVCEIEASPVLFDLANAGLVLDPFGYVDIGASLTPADWITNYVLANSVADGLSWLTLGTMEFASYFTLSFTAKNRLEVLRLLEAATGGELRLRRNGAAGYAIDLVRLIGEGAAPIRAIDGRNLLDYTTATDDTSIRTRVYPIGLTLESGAPSTIADAAFQVVSVPGAAPYWIPLADSAGGIAPIQFADQVNGKYLRKTDETLELILDSRATDSAVLVASVSGIAPGDIVGFANDAAGAPYTIISNPAAIAEYGGVTVPVFEPALRGERNRAQNSRFTMGVAKWTNSDAATFPNGTARLQSLDDAGTLSVGEAADATSLRVTGFRAFEEISCGERLDVEAARLDITGGVLYSDTDGEITVPIDASAIALAEDDVVSLFDDTNTLIGSVQVATALEMSDTALHLKGLVTQKNLIAGDQVRMHRLSLVGVPQISAAVIAARETDCDVQFTFGPARLHELSLAGHSIAITWLNQSSFTTGGVLSAHYGGGSTMTVLNVPCESVNIGGEWFVENLADVLPAPNDPVFHDNSRSSLLRHLTGAQPAWSGGTAVAVLDFPIDITTDTNDAPSATWQTEFNTVTTTPPSHIPVVVNETLWSTSVATLQLRAYDAYRGAPRPAGAFARVASITGGFSVRVVGQTVFSRGNVVLDASGAGTIPISPVLATSKAAGIGVTTWRCPDLTGGDPNNTVRGLVLNRGENGAVRYSDAFTIPRGVTVQLRVAFTAWGADDVVTECRTRISLREDMYTSVVLQSDALTTTLPSELDSNNKRLPIAFETAMSYVNDSSALTRLMRVGVMGGPTSSQTALRAELVVVRWVMINVGTDTDVPYIETSHANALFQRGLLELIRGVTAARQVRVRYLDLVQMSGGQIADTAPVALGAAFTVEELGLTLRVVAFTFVPDAPETGEVILDVIRPRLSTLV
jgi:hypothetical protein